jgi:hypothetical protein
MIMSSLEGRVRAALRATAAEITPRDVPSLAARSQSIIHNDSAPPSWGGGWQHWALRPWGWQHGRWRHWGAPLAAAVAVLAVVAAGLGTSLIARSTAGQGGRAMSGRAAPASGGRPGGTASPAAPASPPAYGSTAVLTQGLIDEFLAASGAQYTAGATFMATVVGPAEDTILARCMTARGFPTPPGSIVADAKSGGSWDLSQFPDLDAIAKAGTLAGGGEVASVKPAPLPSAAATSPSALTVLVACMQPASDPFTVMSRYARTLGDPFLLTVLRIQSSAPQVQATIPALRSCASKYGWPRDSEGNNRPLNTFSDFVTWVTTFLDGPASRGASDATLQALHRHWGPIVVECARPTVTVMESLQAQAQSAFLASHGAQLSHLVNLAMAAFDQAAKDAPQRDT